MAKKKRKGRARRGTGTIYQKPNGRWVGAIVMGYRADTGNPIRKKVYGDTREEIEGKLDELRRRQRAGESLDRGRTPLKFVMEFWLDGKVKPKVDGATYRLHKQRVTDHIIPYLGGRAVAALNEFQVKTWYDDLESKGVSADLRNKCGQLLRRCLDYAIKLRYISSNAARDIELPRAAAEEMHPLDEAQVKRFLAVASRHRLSPLWLLALDTGMRQGELIALEWSDVDLQAGIVSVTKSARTKDRGGVRIKEVKTKASRRRIKLTQRSLEALIEWRQQHRGRIVFPARPTYHTRGQDRYLRAECLGDTFRLLLDRAGLPRIRFHDLRHTHATLALLKTKNVKAISARLGHSDIRVTLDRYTHYLPIMEDELVAAMEELLTPCG